MLVCDYCGYLGPGPHMPEDCRDEIGERLATFADENAGLENNLRAVTAERDAMRGRVAALEATVRRLLLSADAMWEEKNLGHDWREACESARSMLRALLPGGGA